MTFITRSRGWVLSSVISSLMNADQTAPSLDCWWPASHQHAVHGTSVDNAINSCCSRQRQQFDSFTSHCVISTLTRFLNKERWRRRVPTWYAAIRPVVERKLQCRSPHRSWSYEICSWGLRRPVTLSFNLVNWKVSRLPRYTKPEAGVRPRNSSATC